MRRAFTLIELLVVIAIIAILAAILFPVFAQAKEAAKKSSTLAQFKQMGTSINIYLTDHDDLFPQAHRVRPSGTSQQYVWNQRAIIPAGWTRYNNYHLPAGVDEHSQHWSNSVQPYAKNYDIYVAAGMKTVRAPSLPQTAFSVANIVLPWKSTSMTYNGILHTYNATSVVNPSIVPLVWGGEGRIAFSGAALSNPTLWCGMTVSAGGLCRYRPSACSQNRPPGTCYTQFGSPGVYDYAWFWDGGDPTSGYLYNKGTIIVNTDTSAKFVNAQAPKRPDMSRSPAIPWTQMENTPRAAEGSPYWMPDCRKPGETIWHSCFFSPDKEPNYEGFEVAWGA